MKDVDRPVAIASIAEDRGARLAAIDAVRGAAIAAMVVYHTAFDLSVRRLIPVDVTSNPGWVVFARLIAGTFLALVGVGLVLATRRGLKLESFLRRLGLIVGAALLVSLVTWWVEPEAFVFFGILHEIALASVLALPFLWLPSVVVALVAAGAIALPYFYSSPLFDWPPLWWVGLSAHVPATVDYVPVFPWFGVVLAGMVIGRLIVANLLQTPLAHWRPGGPLGKAAVWAGRWSLAIYLIHQPILYGALALASPFLTPNAAAVSRDFNQQCVASCRQQDRDADVCQAFCGCMFTNLNGTDLIKLRSVSQMTPEQRARWNGILQTCAPPPPAPAN
jgi:uncharacterized membrane protein